MWRRVTVAGLAPRRESPAMLPSSRPPRCPLPRGMTDGWDDPSAYGHTLTTQVPDSVAGPLQSLRLVARNSGLFYLSATYQSLRLMRVSRICRATAGRRPCV
eukprot:scaffold137449_cov29-Tisochrysis_lutea.AAC.2